MQNCSRAHSATPVSKLALPNHCQIASKFCKSGVFETGVAERGLNKPQILTDTVVTVVQLVP